MSEALAQVVIVGAGLSGLVCARRLVAAGLAPLVLEARPRVGGRLLSGTLAGATVDLGGQWVSAGQERLQALLRELGLATYPQVRAALPILDEPAVGFWGELARSLRQLWAMRWVERQMRDVRDVRGARGPARAALDRATLREALERQVPDPVVRARLTLHADLVFAVDPAELSLLSYLTTLGATGGFGARVGDLPGGGKEHRVVGGAQRLALDLAAELGARVRCGAAVRRVVQRAAHVELYGAGAPILARRVVLALPPAALARLELELPAAQRALADAAHAGAVVKCFTAYARPFWQARGLPAEVYRPAGLARATVEATVPGHPPALLSFVVGPQALGWAARDPQERRGALLAELAERLGPEAAEPLDYLEHDWAAEPHGAGCVASYPPGALAAGAVLGRQHGRVHFAGTETAARWTGYMDGAIEAGERAAVEVLTAERAGSASPG